LSVVLATKLTLTYLVHGDKMSYQQDAAREIFSSKSRMDRVEKFGYCEFFH